MMTAVAAPESPQPTWSSSHVVFQGLAGGDWVDYPSVFGFLGHHFICTV